MPRPLLAHFRPLPALVLLLMLPAAARAQEQDTEASGGLAAIPDSVTVTPGGAFLRSLALPAWGHASIDSGRGAFYTLTEAGSAWMIVRLGSRIGSTRDVLAVREAEARAAAIVEGIEGAEELEAAISEDEGVQDARSRLEAREQQREDWIALAIFSVLLSGVDAYVSAHLQEFPGMPDPMETALTASPWGGIQFGARVRWPLRP